MAHIIILCGAHRAYGAAVGSGGQEALSLRTTRLPTGVPILLWESLSSGPPKEDWELWGRWTSVNGPASEGERSEPQRCMCMAHIAAVPQAGLSRQSFFA